MSVEGFNIGRKWKHLEGKMFPIERVTGLHPEDGDTIIFNYGLDFVDYYTIEELEQIHKWLSEQFPNNNIITTIGNESIDIIKEDKNNV